MAYMLSYVLPYFYFIKAEPKVVEKLRTLNRALLTQLPPPDGVKEEDAFDGDGGSYYHGTYLWVDYKMTTTNAEDVYIYYNQLFASNGWVNSYSHIHNPADYEYLFSQFPTSTAASQAEYETQVAASPVPTSTPGPISRDVSYYKGSSCVDITIYPNIYWLVIWHDFKNTAPEVEIPPLWLMQLHEFGETHIDTCP